MQFRIEAARREQLPLLAAIERAAADCFPLDVLPADLREHVVAIDRLEAARAAGTLWVATTAAHVIAGYLVGQAFGAELYVVQLDVLPAYQRRGLGRALINRAIDHAQETGLPAITLTTFRTIPWNGPWYRRLGFVELHAEELTPHLVAQLDFERSAGLQDRIAMRFALPLQR